MIDSSRKRTFALPAAESRRTPAVAAFLLAPLTVVLLLVGQTASGEESAADAPSPGKVTQEILEAKIEEIESSGATEGQAQAKLIDLYRKALSNLRTAGSNAAAAEAFQRTAQTAPAQMQAIRQEMDASSPAAAEEPLQVDPATPSSELAARLQKEKADLAAVDARRADFEKRLGEQAARTPLIRQRLIEGKEGQDEIAGELKLAPPAGESAAMTEARRWELMTRYEALSTELKMLDQELLSQPARVDLLKLRRDKEATRVSWVGERVKALEALLNHQRQLEADNAKLRAEATRRGAKGQHPLVRELAERNAGLTEVLAHMASQLSTLAEEQGRTETLADQIEGDFERARETVAIGGLSQELGHMLLQQRQTLPDRRSFARRAEERETGLATIGLQRLRHRAEAKRLQDLDAYVTELVAGEPEKPAPAVYEGLRGLATERRPLLAKALETEDFYLRKLGELNAVQQRLLRAIGNYDAFLNEHLLWVRSASRAQLAGLGALPEQVWRFLSPAGWIEVARALGYQATHSPVLVLLGLFLGALLWSRERLIAGIQDIGTRLGKPTTDRFAYTLQVLGLTLVAASAWPLVIAGTGWQLKLSTEGTDFSNAVGQSLLLLATQFFFLRGMRLICMPGGLAAAHFRWPETSVRLLRRELDRLTRIFLPSALVTLVAYHLDPLNMGWEVGRAAFLIVLASLAFAFYRLLHPKQGVLSGYLDRRERRTLRRLYPLWYALVVAAPLALGVAALLGFAYTAGTLLTLLLDTTWMAVSLVLLNALGVRWLLVTRRHLAYAAAMERRQALLEPRLEDAGSRSGNEGVPFDVEEPEVDLAALSDASRRLVSTGVIFIGLVGLTMIWSVVFPAFGILDTVTLWHQGVTVDGVDKVLPVTLADLGLAIIYSIATVVLAKQLPAVLEIILLKQSGMSGGGRYTVTTLTNYAIVTIGVVMVFKTLGTDWSKLQWLVAALGVGVGFGLQEIVANFISGIIILFERPVRVGDVVTVGDTDGTVTRIRIRATTIKNWDGKELLVPNKEFITGRLLNWSLSDQTTRLLISVGIAYGSNVRQAMRLLEEAARENPTVLNDPAPSVIFEAFGDNALTMVLRCFVDSVDVRLRTISDLNEAINDKFNKAGIVIAFPQRDLHLDSSGPLQVEVRRARGAPAPDGGPVGTA